MIVFYMINFLWFLIILQKLKQVYILHSPCIDEVNFSLCSFLHSVSKFASVDKFCW